MKINKRKAMWFCVSAFIFCVIIFSNAYSNEKHTIEMSYISDELHSDVRFKDVCLVGTRRWHVVPFKVFNRIFLLGWAPPYYRVSGSVETDADKQDILKRLKAVRGIRIEDKLCVKEGGGQ